MSDLLSTRELVNTIRFSGDKHCAGEIVQGPAVVWSRFASAGMEVSEETTPHIAHSVQNVCDRLSVEWKSVRCFVFPDANMQASCLSISADVCGVRLASSLVECLKSTELEFVIGHEVGHYLLGPMAGGPENGQLEIARTARSREISCDRVGLLACESVDHAVGAIMKVASGLSETFLRFDSSSFMRSALREIGTVSDPASMFASHPPLAVRARALLWFDTFRRDVNSLSECRDWTRLRSIDERVEHDLRRYVDFHEEEFLQKLREQLDKWLWLCAIVGAGRFSQRNQEILEERFAAFVEQAKGRLRGSDPAEVESWVKKSAWEAFSSLNLYFPALARETTKREVLASELALLEPGEKSLLRRVTWFSEL